MPLSRVQFDPLALDQMDLLYRMARRLTGNPSAAEDLVQETYLRAFKSANHFELQSFGIRPWLVRIMHNLHLSRVGREQRQPASMEDQILESNVPASQTQLPLNPSDFEGMDEHLVRALDQLTAEYQAPLLLWAVEDFSYKEIAQAMEIPIGTVMSRLHRARQKLSEQLREYVLKERMIRE